jgi:hypothetical protein
MKTPTRIIIMSVFTMLMGITSCTTGFDFRHQRHGHRQYAPAEPGKAESGGKRGGREISPSVEQNQEADLTAVSERRDVEPIASKGKLIPFLREGARLLGMGAKRHANPNDTCDIILMKDGSEMSVKVTEIGVTEIRYKNCDDQDGPVYVIGKKQVTVVLFANGKRYSPSQDLSPGGTKPESKETRGDATLNILSISLAALGLAILLISPLGFGLVFIAAGLAIAAIILGIFGLRRKLKGLGIAGIAIGGLVFAIVAMITFIAILTLFWFF